MSSSAVIGSLPSPSPSLSNYIWIGDGGMGVRKYPMSEFNFPSKWRIITPLRPLRPPLILFWLFLCRSSLHTLTSESVCVCRLKNQPSLICFTCPKFEILNVRLAFRSPSHTHRQYPIRSPLHPLCRPRHTSLIVDFPEIPNTRDTTPIVRNFFFFFIGMSVAFLNWNFKKKHCKILKSWPFHDQWV